MASSAGERGPSSAQRVVFLRPRSAPLLLAELTDPIWLDGIGNALFGVVYHSNSGAGVRDRQGGRQMPLPLRPSGCCCGRRPRRPRDLAGDLARRGAGLVGRGALVHRHARANPEEHHQPGASRIQPVAGRAPSDGRRDRADRPPAPRRRARRSRSAPLPPRPLGPRVRQRSGDGCDPLRLRRARSTKSWRSRCPRTRPRGG